MIHNSWTIGYGNKNDFKDTAEFLDKIDKSISKDYANKTGLAIEEIETIMDDETWMDSEEAKEKGFVNKVIKDKAVDNSFNLSVYENAPKMKTEPQPKPNNKDVRKIIARIAKVKSI